jgi:hypothetical protein
MESVKIFSAAQHVPELRGSAFDEIAPHDVRLIFHDLIAVRLILMIRV